LLAGRGRGRLVRLKSLNICCGANFKRGSSPYLPN
jgi:hypothetical protein